MDTKTIGGRMVSIKANPESLQKTSSGGIITRFNDQRGPPLISGIVKMKALPLRLLRYSATLPPRRRAKIPELLHGFFLKNRGHLRLLTRVR